MKSGKCKNFYCILKEENINYEMSIETINRLLLMKYLRIDQLIQV